MNNILPQIIGICGKRRSGKDLTANFICSQYNYANKKIASDLKSIIKILFGFSDSQLESDEKDIIDPVWNITPRQPMQFFGTEIMQYKIQELIPDIDRKFWIKSFINKNIHKDSQKIVISDLRFLHEYEELKKYNVIIIRIERKTDTNNLVDEHISEKEYLKIPADVVIQNDGSIEDLYKKIQSLDLFP